jgi:membrane-associated PAP2 superfamily phosphatase
VLLLMSALVVALNMDQTIAGWLWSDAQGWRYADARWVRWLYQGTCWPALLTGAVGLGAAIGSVAIAPLRAWRGHGLFLALSLLIGPGLVVNAVLKPHYGRPRPRQVREFGGFEAFRQLGSPTFDPMKRSFPSGHASMGFYWLAPAVLCWNARRRLAYAFMALALVHGGMAGLARMVQGAHWFSDVLWSAGCVYFTVLALYAVRSGLRHGRGLSPVARLPEQKTRGWR